MPAIGALSDEVTLLYWKFGMNHAPFPPIALSLEAQLAVTSDGKPPAGPGTGAAWAVRTLMRAPMNVNFPRKPPEYRSRIDGANAHGVQLRNGDLRSQTARRDRQGRFGREPRI